MSGLKLNFPPSAQPGPVGRLGGVSTGTLDLTKKETPDAASMPRGHVEARRLNREEKKLHFSVMADGNSRWNLVVGEPRAG